VAQLGHDPLGALVFSCTGRVAPLGQHLRDEASAISSSIGGSPMAGFFTYGEFARLTGSTGFHNATVVALAL
jgi:small ligand-binding sensory domain FIST